MTQPIYYYKKSLKNSISPHKSNISLNIAGNKNIEKRQKINYLKSKTKYQGANSDGHGFHLNLKQNMKQKDKAQPKIQLSISSKKDQQQSETNNNNFGRTSYPTNNISQNPLQTNKNFKFNETNRSNTFQQSIIYLKNKIKPKKHQKQKNQQTSKFFSLPQQVCFTKIDPKRISRYNKSKSTQIQQNQRFDKSLQRYMLARTKMSQFFNQSKNNTGQFDQIQLNKSNQILRKRKLDQLVSLSPNSKQKQIRRNQFVSYLIPKSNKNKKSNIQSQILLKNDLLKNTNKYNNNSGIVKRCDALLVNFVSTYFRKKFYKKSKKIYSMRRTKTDDIQMVGMVGLQGTQITDEYIYQNLPKTSKQSNSNINKINNKKLTINQINLQNILDK